ncbi:hypothetical protein THAOC_23781 [Thalassiosira oceanica]|uniref:MYND-type domain-containing protein n=1 Tax=Thalassiosira oceanica TaxID=159749 RepID=K0SCB2_THAOC|nr:hypothetical protein THAOC_23781 [Thalassiosira oceanica]|eukprot:EJK56352.1 hypothetical protein THAOC_23781 [Thalassiosira oceanica]
MLGSIVEDHRTIDLDVKWHGEFDGATLKGRYSTGKKLRTKASRDRANCDLAGSNEAMAVSSVTQSLPKMPSAKKLRGKQKKKAKKQRENLPAVDAGPDAGPVQTASEVGASRAFVQREARERALSNLVATARVAKEKVASIVECEASLIKVPLELDDDELRGLMDFGLLGALLFRVHYGFDEKCEESFASREADILQSLSRWFGLLSIISLRSPAEKCRLIPQYLEKIIPQPFYFGSDEEHNPKTWIALVICKVVDRLMTCNTFYKSKRLHQSAFSGVLHVLATLVEVADEDGAVIRLDITDYNERYPVDALQLMDEREEFLKFTCKEMISLAEYRLIAMESSADRYEAPSDPYFSGGRHLVFSEDDMASDGSDWTDSDSVSSSEGDHIIKSEDYDMEIDGPGEERKFLDVACYVRCILFYRMHYRESNNELDNRMLDHNRMLDLATLPTREGSIFIRDIIAILRGRTFNSGAQDECLKILDHLVSNNCVDEETIQNLVYFARESNDWFLPMNGYGSNSDPIRKQKADITQVLNMLAKAFQWGRQTTQGSAERRVGVAIKAGLLDVILGFLSIVSKSPSFLRFKPTRDTLGAAARVLVNVVHVANKKKARIAIIACQEGVSRELSSLRELLQKYDECNDVLNKLQSVLDEGTGPVARTCSVCSRILGSGAIFRCECCGEVYCSPVCQKISWRAGHHSICTEKQKKVYRTNPGMLEDHAKYMLGVWINHGEEELVKVMEETLVFPGAGAGVLTGCANILHEKQETLVFPGAGAGVLTGCANVLHEKHDSNEWDQVSAMIMALYENNLVSKSDIGAGMEALGILCIEDSLDHFGDLFCQLAIRNLYTLKQLCKATAPRLNTLPKRFNMIRVCMEKMYHLHGREFTGEFFWESHNQVLVIEEFLGKVASEELFVWLFTKYCLENTGQAEEKQRIKEGCWLLPPLVRAKPKPEQAGSTNKVAHQQDISCNLVHYGWAEGPLLSMSLGLSSDISICV